MRRTIGPSGVTLDATGSGSVFFQPSGSNIWWDIQRLSVNGDSDRTPFCEVVLLGSIIDSTYRGNGNHSDYPHPITLPPGNPLVVRWYNGSSGAHMLATAVIEEYRR